MSPANSPRPPGRGVWSQRQWGLFVGAGVFALLLTLSPPAGMTLAAWRTAAVAALMLTWWVLESVPVPATALLPVVLLPLLGVTGLEEASAPYANPVIGLFLGGFLIAQAMQTAGLHRRLALRLVTAVGTRPDRMVGAFMATSALLSMWISNTATAVMMLPIGLSVSGLLRRTGTGNGDQAAGRDFPVALMLAIAYGCSIGGLGTLIGSPPNALLAAFMADRFDVNIGFIEWMAIGMPLVLVGLPLTWIVLTRVVYRVPRAPVEGVTTGLREELASLGPLSTAERSVAAVFTLTALAWMVRPLLERVLPGLSDTGIALLGALSLFALPVEPADGRRALDWESARHIPWDVLVLFGGGLSLAGAMSRSGLADWLGGALSGLHGLPVVVTLVILTTAIILVTELMSNTAAVATFLPVLAVLAVDMGQPPLAVTAPAALAASCAFMMPVATPPNAIAFGSGQVTMRQMIRAGIVLNLIFIVLVSLWSLRFVD